MQNEPFEWLQAFVPERIEVVTIERDPCWNSEGVKFYREKISTQGVFIKDAHAQNAAGDPQRFLTVLLPGFPEVLPGDRITAKAGSFELDSVENCCDFRGNIVVRKCQIK